MDLKDILSVGLTAEDFETLMEGLDAIPEKGVSQEIVMGMVTAMAAAGSTPQRQEEAKRSSINKMREMEKKINARKDDLVILKSKLILLKRLLAGNQAMEEVKTILTPPTHTRCKTLTAKNIVA